MSVSIAPKSPCRCDVKTSFDQIKNQETQLLPLPSELIVKILHDLPDFEDRLNFSLTCREIRAITFAEEKPLRVNQIRALISFGETYFDEDTLSELIQILCDFEETESLNFMQMCRRAYKIELSLTSMIRTQISSTENSELIISISPFSSNEMKYVVFIAFFNLTPCVLRKSKVDSILSYAGGYAEILKIVRLAELLITPEDFDLIRLNIVNALLKQVNAYNIKKIIEISGSSRKCILLAFSNLKSIIETHIKSGDEKNLQKAIELASLLPEYYRYDALIPIIIFYCNDDNIKSLQKALELACSFTCYRSKYTSLEKIVDILVDRGDRWSLYEVADFDSNLDFKIYVWDCIKKLKHKPK